MGQGLQLVLDIGKTAAKLSVWDRHGKCLARLSHANRTIDASGYRALDVTGIETWLEQSLRESAVLGTIDAIIPVGHGAAAAIIAGGELALPVFDYESSIPDEVSAAYERTRDPVALSGSPAMPWGLNLGRQLFFLNQRFPEVFAQPSTIVPWSQFWAWRLSGVAVSEVSSLGAHTDLWAPTLADFSPMAKRKGWAAKLAPFAQAGSAVGHLSPEWQSRTGLGAELAVYAGLHDSNAALHAARGRHEFASGDATILSTGTWFVTMRSTAKFDQFDLASFATHPGCLVNVDVRRRPVPTALFMGGREFEAVAQESMALVEDETAASDLLSAASECVANSIMALPAWQGGTGFFPELQGSWSSPPANRMQHCAASLLYLALLVDHALSLVGSTRLVVIDGRFANYPLFTGALAALRPDLQIAVADAENDVALGALRAAGPAYPVNQDIRPVAALPLDLKSYQARWRAASDRM